MVIKQEAIKQRKLKRGAHSCLWSIILRGKNNVPCTGQAVQASWQLLELSREKLIYQIFRFRICFGFGFLITNSFKNLHLQMSEFSTHFFRLILRSPVKGRPNALNHICNINNFCVFVQGRANALTHNSNVNKTVINAIWTPPSFMSGEVVIFPNLAGHNVIHHFPRTNKSYITHTFYQQIS